MNFYQITAIFAASCVAYGEARTLCSNVCDCIKKMDDLYQDEFIIMDKNKNSHLGKDLNETYRVLQRLDNDKTRFGGLYVLRQWFIAFWNLHPVLRKHQCKTKRSASKFVEVFAKSVERWFREGKFYRVDDRWFPGAHYSMTDTFSYIKRNYGATYLENEAAKVCKEAPDDKLCVVLTIGPASVGWHMINSYVGRDPPTNADVRKTYDDLNKYFVNLTSALLSSSVFLKWQNPILYSQLEPVTQDKQRNASNSLIRIILDAIESEDMSQVNILSEYVPKPHEIPGCRLTFDLAFHCIAPKLMISALEAFDKLYTSRPTLKAPVTFHMLKNAIMLKVAILKFYDPIDKTAVEPKSRYRNIFTNAMDNIMAAINKNEIHVIQELLTYLPKTADVLGCDPAQPSSAQCNYERIQEQLQLFVNSYVNPNKQRKRIILETNIDFKEFLKNRQTEEILKTVQKQSIFITEVARVVQNRFGELRNYFYQVQDFNKKKASADISYINTMLTRYKASLGNISYDVGNKTGQILNYARISSIVNLIEKTATVALVIAQMCNPLKQVFGGSNPTELTDAMADLSKAIAQVIKSQTLSDSFDQLKRDTVSLTSRLDENAGFLENVRSLVVSSEVNDNNFEKNKKEFLEKYAAYDPKVKKPEISVIGEMWNQIIEKACGIIDEKGIGSSGIESKVNYEGLCWKAPAKVQGMIETLNEIYDFQFDLIEALASTMKAKTAVKAATEINAEYDATVDVTSDNLPFKTRNYATLTYVTYKVQEWQAVQDYCDILEYKNGGVRPEECKRSTPDISLLISRPDTGCTSESIQFVDIPVKTSSDFEKNAGSSSLPQTSSAKNDMPGKIDMDDLFSGRPTSFQVPDKEWLVQHRWIGKSALLQEQHFYVKAFSLFLPTQSHKERLITVTATASIDNKFATEGPKYIIAPATTFVYEYKEGNGFLACFQREINNPYSICSTRKLPNICPLTREVSSRQQSSVLYPSIYSKWMLRIEGYNDTLFPHHTTLVAVKAGIVICKVSKTSDYSEFQKRSQLSTADWGCCDENKYWSAQHGRCETCPTESTPLLNGYYCEKSKPLENTDSYKSSFKKVSDKKRITKVRGKKKKSRDEQSNAKKKGNRAAMAETH